MQLGNILEVDKMLRLGVLVDSHDEYGCTALHWAAQIGQTNLIYKLLSNGANVNAQDRFGSTALHRAVKYNSADATQALIQHGACTWDVKQISNTSTKMTLSKSFLKEQPYAG